MLLPPEAFGGENAGCPRRIIVVGLRTSWRVIVDWAVVIGAPVAARLVQTLPCQTPQHTHMEQQPLESAEPRPVPDSVAGYMETSPSPCWLFCLRSAV